MLVDVLISALQTLRTRRGVTVTGKAEPTASLAKATAGSDNEGV